MPNKTPEPSPPIKIGERFSLLGREMLCVRHHEIDYPFDVIVALYFTVDGSPHTYIFPPAFFTAIEIENDRAVLV